MTQTMKFIRRGTTKIGNSSHGLVIPTQAAEMIGLKQNKYYIFYIKAQEIKDLNELEEWQEKKFEILDEHGRKIEKADTAADDFAGVAKSGQMRTVRFLGVL